MFRESRAVGPVAGVPGVQRRGLVEAAAEEVGVAAEEVGDGGGTAAFELDLLQGKDTLGGGYGGRGFRGVQGDYLAGGGVRGVGMVKSGYG